MKNIFLLIVLLAFTGHSQTDKIEIGSVLDSWHRAAANANFNEYFALMTDDAVFIGTDAAENWPLETFKSFAKPIFATGKAWDFKAVERNIYFSPDGKTAWFDELLDTWMKLCRGSGVLLKVDGKWRIAQYVLSTTVPNDNIVEVVKIKTAYDDAYLQQLKNKK